MIVAHRNGVVLGICWLVVGEVASCIYIAGSWLASSSFVDDGALGRIVW